MPQIGDLRASDVLRQAEESMGTSLGSLLMPAALFFGAPHNEFLGVYERGLFCDMVELVEFVVRVADRGGDPQRTVKQINQTLGRRACLYKVQPEVLTQTVQFERNIAANDTTYSIYQVQVSALGHQTSEVGDLVWSFARPVVMYTLRKDLAQKSPDH